MRWSRLLAVAVILFPAFARADAPKPPSSTATFFNGGIQFTPPVNWTLTAVKSRQTSETVAIYIADDHDGYFAIQILPTNASVIDPHAARKILGQLKVNHKKAGQEIVQEAAIEADERMSDSRSRSTSVTRTPRTARLPMKPTCIVRVERPGD